MICKKEIICWILTRQRFIGSSLALGSACTWRLVGIALTLGQLFLEPEVKGPRVRITSFGSSWIWRTFLRLCMPWSPPSSTMAMDCYVGLPLRTVQKLQLVQHATAHMLTGVSQFHRGTFILKELPRLPVVFWVPFKVLVLTLKPYRARTEGVWKIALPYKDLRNPWTLGEGEYVALLSKAL